MATIQISTDEPGFVTPLERYNIMHPLWDSDDSDEDIEPCSFGIDIEPLPMTLAELDVSGLENPDEFRLPRLPELYDDVDPVVNLATVFDEEIIDHELVAAINADRIGDDLTALTDDSDFDEEYEDDENQDEMEYELDDEEDEEEFAQRDDNLDLDDDFLEYMNMNRAMADQHIISKSTWRYRKELIEFDLYVCACTNNGDINEGDVASECTGKCFCEPEGLFALAVMHQAQGNAIARHDKRIEAESFYEMTIALSPYNAPCYMECAQIHETCYDNFVKAETFYLKAIEIHENEMAMYNLGCMHLRLYDDGKGEAERLNHAIECFSMGCDTGDTVSSNMVCLLLYKNYPLHVEEFAYRFSRLSHNKTRYVNCKRLHKEFLEEVGVINLYERLKASEPQVYTNEPPGTYTMKVLAEISSHRQVSPYVAKVALFTRLNNVTECGICYEEKLNIDLQCGHTTCTDCYKRVYMNECPFCRFAFDQL